MSVGEGVRIDWCVAPGGALRGSLDVPGDKSISHRALMIAAIAEGESRISGFLEAADTHATAAILGALGVRIEAPAAGVRRVWGAGPGGLRAPDAALDCGNSGTAMRLLAGLLAGQGVACVLTGDASLRRRPMQRVIDPLRAMGARIAAAPGGLPPLRLEHVARLRGIACDLPVASAQVKSAILLAGLGATGETLVREPQPTRDYTERLLRAFGWTVDCGPGWARIAGGGVLHGRAVRVPGDFSAAAFFLVAATITPGSDLLLRGVALDPRRTGLLRALRAMGADIAEEAPGEADGLPVADLRVRHAPLEGVDVPPAWVADMIDEFPVLFVAAAAARGSTRVRGAAELRVKESDRLATMATALRRLGIEVEETADGATVTGGPLRGGRVASAGDHRCAMALAVAGLVADAPVEITDCAHVGTSFPGFAALARGCGFDLRESRAGSRGKD